MIRGAGGVSQGLIQMLRDYARKAYRKVLLAVLGATRGFYKLDISIPSRWQGLFNTLQASSGLVYSTLSMLDEEVEQEVLEWETRFERSFGNKKYYSEEEIDKISKEFSQIHI